MASLSKDKQAKIITIPNSASSYLNNLLDIDNPYLGGICESNVST